MFCGSGGLRGEDLLWPRLDQSNYSCSSQLNSNGLLISSFIRIYVHANYRASSQLCLLIVIEGCSSINSCASILKKFTNYPRILVERLREKKIG